MKLGVTRLSRTRTAALLGAALLALTGSSAWLWRFLHSGQHDFAGLLTGTAGLVLLVATTWLSAISLVLFVESLTSGRRQGPRWLAAPAALRTLVLLTSGVALSAGLTGPASAETTVTPSRVSGLFDGLTLPDRPQGSAPTRVDPTAIQVVRAGDTLWTIARRTSPHATNADLVDLVRRWHEANRSVIGPDPDRIVPGQSLVDPGTVTR